MKKIFLNSRLASPLLRNFSGKAMNSKSVPLALIISIWSLYGCSGSGGESHATGSTSVNTTIAGDSVYYGKNSVTYSVNGKHVAIKDQLKTGEGKYQQALFINEAKNHAEDAMIKIQFTNLFTSEVFTFVVSNKGSTVVRKGAFSVANALSNKTSSATYMGSNVTNYYGNAATIAITSEDDTHVSGTFSGTFAADADNLKSPVTITDGSFDVLLTKDNGNAN